MDITVAITTRNRYYSSLPLCLMSILNQTLLPKEIILVDDNDKKEFFDIQIYKDILKLSKIKNIKFSYYHGQSKGQVYAQQISLEHTITDWIFNTDDDNVLENNVLELLSNMINDKTGAVSGLILSSDDLKRKIEFKSDIYNKIDDIYSLFNIQICGNQDNKIKKVEHIYSNYLFRKELVDSYPLEFAPAGHRSETVVTYEIYKKGFDLLINPKAMVYHLHSQGGNRIHKFDNSNDIKFIKKLKDWNIIPNKLKIYENDDGVFTIRNNIEYLIIKK